ncbi:unnamed protein product [Protopolystoma xenopodis]|uniref:tyrosine--tRNA ligase n=1 Tax=Protopolystoma xenopodis TaxID=117903 RepID=A0A448XLV2_9PLAT|nr:unnamed protein product [Protopolystoma xenopodis]
MSIPFVYEYLPHLGYRKRIHLMNPMIPGLSGVKMSSSEIDSKIDLLDSADLVMHKIRHSVCQEGVTAANGNGLLAFMRYVVFPLAGDGLLSR